MNECSVPVLSEMARFFGFKVYRSRGGYVLDADSFDYFCPSLHALQRRLYARAGWERR